MGISVSLGEKFSDSSQKILKSSVKRKRDYRVEVTRAKNAQTRSVLTLIWGMINNSLGNDLSPIVLVLIDRNR